MTDEQLTLYECQHGLAEWGRHAEAQLETINHDIEALEEAIEEGEDRLMRDGAILALLGVMISTTAAFLSIKHPWAGAVINSIGSFASGLGSGRVLAWRRIRRQLRARLKAAQSAQRAWEKEAQLVDRARVSIDSELRGQLAAKAEERSLQAPRKTPLLPSKSKPRPKKGR